MGRWTRRSAVALACILVAIQFVRPERTNPSGEPGHALAAVRPMPAHVAIVFERSCRDCHSNATRWPWYSNVAPVSWLVIDHVNHGRTHFNYSEWSRYDPAEAERLLKNACDLVRQGEMPLGSYTLVHSDARLTQQDIDALCGWTLEAARR